MFTLADIISVKPPGSPIADNAYWDALREMAEERVKVVCRRRLEADVYSESGRLLNLDNGWVWWLREPTGEVIPYDQFTVLKLNGNTVAEDDVVIKPDYLQFQIGGLVELTYPGGYCRNDEKARQLKIGVVYAMHALHNIVLAGGMGSLPVGGSSAQIESLEAIDAMLRRMLEPLILPGFVVV